MRRKKTKKQNVERKLPDATVCVGSSIEIPPKIISQLNVLLEKSKLELIQFWGRCTRYRIDNAKGAKVTVAGRFMLSQNVGNSFQAQFKRFDNKITISTPDPAITVDQLDVMSNGLLLDLEAFLSSQAFNIRELEPIRVICSRGVELEWAVHWINHCDPAFGQHEIEFYTNDSFPILDAIADHESLALLSTQQKTWEFAQTPHFIIYRNADDEHAALDLRGLELKFFPYLSEEQRWVFLSAFVNQDQLSEILSPLFNLQAYEDILSLLDNCKVKFFEVLETTRYIDILYQVDDPRLEKYFDPQIWPLITDQAVLAKLQNILRYQRETNALGKHIGIEEWRSCRKLARSVHHHEFAQRVEDFSYASLSAKFENEFDNCISRANLFLKGKCYSSFLEEVCAAFAEHGGYGHIDNAIPDNRFSNIFSAIHPMETHWNDKKVTLLMTAHNAAETIGYSIESVISQSLQNWELLICDDRSSDTTVELIREKMAKEDRISFIHNTEHLGTYASKNRLLDLAVGEFIVCFDSDDWMCPWFLEQNYNLLEQQSLSTAVMSDMLRYSDKQGFELGKNHHKENLCSLFYRRHVVNNLRYDNNRFGADAKFVADIKKAYGRGAILRVNKALAILDRSSDKNLTRTNNISVYAGGRSDINRRLYSAGWKGND